MQLFEAVPGQVHPAPDIDTRVKPDGTVSVTVTVPLVDPALAPLETVTLYVAFCCPAAKLPVCVLAIESEGGDVLVPFGRTSSVMLWAGAVSPRFVPEYVASGNNR